MGLGPIDISSEQELQRLIDHIAFDASMACDYWSLAKGLDEKQGEYFAEMNRTRAFWSLTIEAHLQTTISVIARVYDQTNGALNLGNLLHTIGANAHHFSAESFERRLAANPYIKELLSARRNIEQSELEKEIRSVSALDPLVGRLVALRNRFFSHRDGSLVKLANLSRLAGLSTQDIDELVDRAVTLTSKYSQLFLATQYSSRTLGWDDFTTVLATLRQGFRKAG